MCFGLVGSRPGPVTAAALYAMMGRAAAAGGDGSYSSRSAARRGAGGGAAGRGESVRQRGGMGRASVPGPSMAAEWGGAGRGVARPPAQCEAARRWLGLKWPRGPGVNGQSYFLGLTEENLKNKKTGVKYQVERGTFEK